MNSPYPVDPVDPVRISHQRTRAGQAIIEACIAIGIICLLFFGMLQVSLLFAAREVLSHSAARAARAKTVGFNRFMVSKVAHVASIPNAGRMLVPDIDASDPVLLELVTERTPGVLWDAVFTGEDAELGPIIPRSLQADVEMSRIPDYLYSPNWPTARRILDYQNWDPSEPNGIHIDLPISTGIDSLLTVTISQQVPMRIPLHRTFYAPEDDNVHMQVSSQIEKHYDLYIEDYNW